MLRARVRKAVSLPGTVTRPSALLRASTLEPSDLRTAKQRRGGIPNRTANRRRALELFGRGNNRPTGSPERSHRIGSVWRRTLSAKNAGTRRSDRLTCGSARGEGMSRRSEADAPAKALERPFQFRQAAALRKRCGRVPHVWQHTEPHRQLSTAGRPSSRCPEDSRRQEKW